MKIKKLEICGFKSFVDKTVVVFDRDVTCVVGPNGCGKSNIVDAIRWVMGEQSAKNLRGKSMEDIIFNGSESRGPVGLAEVSLTFDNTDGLAPAEYRDYAEITVSRRLSRTGESDYFINKTLVRLMDVTNLFLGTGVGRRAYSIIEQGRIGFIVSAKPEDRRFLIEEAAGITKFKLRKKAAERKMDQTKQNLLRVSDILLEIEKNLGSLKRQAQKAERYKEYRAEIRDNELWVASHQWLEYTAQQKVLVSQLEIAQASVAEERVQLETRETELETRRVEADTLARQVEGAQARAYELDNTVKLLESQIKNDQERIEDLQESERFSEREITELAVQHQELQGERAVLAERCREHQHIAEGESQKLAEQSQELDLRQMRADEVSRTAQLCRDRSTDAQTRMARGQALLSGFERRAEENRTRLERLKNDILSLEQRQAELKEERADFRVRLETLQGGQGQTQERRLELEENLQRLRGQIQESDGVVDTLRSELSHKRSRLRSLEELESKFEGVGAGVRALMSRHGSPLERSAAGLTGLVVDKVDCPPDLTQALAAALGEKLQCVVVRDRSSALAALESLRRDRLGRATVMAPPNRAHRAVDLSSLKNETGVVGVFSELVTASLEDHWLATHLLSDVLVVEDLPTALRLHEDAGASCILVTREGEVIAPDGRMTGGLGEDVGAHRLELKREVRELADVVSQLDEKLTAAVTRHAELRSGIVEHQALLEAARSEGHEVEIAIVKTEKDEKRLEHEAETLSQRYRQECEHIAELEHALTTSNQERVDAEREVFDAQRLATELEAELLELDQAARDALEKVQEQNQIVADFRVRAAQANERLQADNIAVERLTRSIEELEARKTRLLQDIAQAKTQVEEIRARMLECSLRLQSSVTEGVVFQEELSALRAAYDALKIALSEQEIATRALRTQLEAHNQHVNELTLNERELSLALAHLMDQISQRYRMDLRTAVGEFHQRDLPDETVFARIEELTRIIERMGEINLTAIEEYEEQQRRHVDLAAQYKDLQTAMEELEKAIRQMNRESRRLFHETFHAVNERFQKVFPKMFGGGKGELRLTNPDDMLETGVEIVAQPPGKRLSAIELLSGGEKALTAVSLIFAIFQVKPSPFCLLDEVDAPLDEANIGRFAEAIRQMTHHSQFILISHSKRTMEMADVLYGVTMEVPGISKMVSVELRQSEPKKKRPENPTDHIEQTAAV